MYNIYYIYYIYIYMGDRGSVFFIDYRGTSIDEKWQRHYLSYFCQIIGTVKCISIFSGPAKFTILRSCLNHLTRLRNTRRANYKTRSATREQ